MPQQPLGGAVEEVASLPVVPVPVAVAVAVDALLLEQRADMVIRLPWRPGGRLTSISMLASSKLVAYSAALSFLGFYQFCRVCLLFLIAVLCQLSLAAGSSCLFICSPVCVVLSPCFFFFFTQCLSLPSSLLGFCFFFWFVVRVSPKTWRPHAHTHTLTIYALTLKEGNFEIFLRKFAARRSSQDEGKRITDKSHSFSFA